MKICWDRNLIIAAFAMVLIIVSLVVPTIMIFKLYEARESAVATAGEVTAQGSISLSVIGVCGDGVCDTGENVTSCPADCEEAEEEADGGAGGGGGGGGVSRRAPTFIFDPDLIQEVLTRGETVSHEVNITNVGNKPFDIYLTVSGVKEFVFLDTARIYLARRAKETFDALISTTQTTEPGIYIGDIYGTSGDVKKNVQIVLTVLDEDAPILVSVVVLDGGEVVYPGDILDAQATITSNYGETIPVTVEYSLRTRQDTVLYSREEPIQLSSGETILRDTFTLGRDLDPDHYLFYVKVIHGTKSYAGVDAFKVGLPGEGLVLMDFMYYGLVILLIILILIIYRFRNKLKFWVIFSKRKKKKKKETVDPKFAIIAVRKLTKLKSIKKEEYDSGSLDAYLKIVRSFFSKRYSVRYSFTFEELIRELGKKDVKSKVRVTKFLKRIAHISYLKTPISYSEFKALIDSTISLINSVGKTKVQKK